MSPMSAERMMHEIASVLPRNTIIADDSVTSRDAIHDAINFNQPVSLFGERGGALGWGMGGALGIKLAHPDRPVVGVIGDGSSMMTVQALWTAANANIPVVYVICNNKAYRILKLNMDVYKQQVKRGRPSEPVPADGFPESYAHSRHSRSPGNPRTHHHRPIRPGHCDARSPGTRRSGSLGRVD